MDTTASSLFACSAELVAVAQDSGIGFYSTATLRKLRVSRLGDFRLVGLFIDGDSTLFALDSKRTCYRFSLAHFEVEDSFQLDAAVDSTEAGGATLPVVRSGRAKRLTNPAGEAGAVAGDALAAHFHRAPRDTRDGAFREGDLCVAMLTGHGVLHAKVDGSAGARALLRFPPGIAGDGAFLSVGHRSGIVVVGQRGQKWLWSCDAFSSAALGSTSPISPKQTTLTIGVSCVACAPQGPGVAVGGVRGELVLLPDVAAPSGSYFAEHWHHTPMASMTFSVDGSALYTGAAESIVLCWNLSDYSYRKLGVSLGTILAITTSEAAPSQLVLTCGDSTLARVDLAQHRVAQSVEGIPWSASRPCSGLAVLPWMGQRCIALTGLPDVVRICDPISQQAVHSLHISYQMETIVRPPSVGIAHVAVLDEGRTILTYENAEAFALPSALRWWRYDAATRKHAEVQCIYSPHRSAITALVADPGKRRFFTLSADAIKVWAERTPAAGSSTRFGSPAQWRNGGATEPPSPRCTTMALSADGSVLCVADDSVHAMFVGEIALGKPWPRLRSMVQSATTAAARRVLIVELAHDVVAAAAIGNWVFTWPLLARSSDRAAPVACVDIGAPVVGLTLLAAGVLLAATADGTLHQVHAATGAIVGISATHRGVRFVEALQPGSGRVAVVIETSGLHIVSVKVGAPRDGGEAAEAAEAAEIDADEDLRAASAAATASEGGSGHPAPPTTLAAYFRVKGDAAVGVTQRDARGSRSHATSVAATRRWLSEVVGGEAYSAPPMASVFSAFVSVLEGE